MEAVRCAVLSRTSCVQEPQEPLALQLRIGINLGDIIIEEDGDITGMG